MNADIIQTLTATFEANAQQTETGVENWLARDLQHLLGYNEWRNFTLVIAKARTACEVSGHRIADHFVDANKMVELGSGRKASRFSVPDRERGEQRTERIRVMDWSHEGGPANNDFLLVSQFSVTGALYTCRPDLVGFVTACRWWSSN